MKKYLFLGLLLCVTVMRPAFAEWITCRDAYKDGYGGYEPSDYMIECGQSAYYDTCGYETDSDTINCTYFTACSCPSSHPYGSCSNGDYSNCYKYCSETCRMDVNATNCPYGWDIRKCDDMFNRIPGSTCNTGKMYYGSSTCNPSNNCGCEYDIAGNYVDCPSGYTDCKPAYNADTRDPSDMCCKILSAGEYIETARGNAVTCDAGYYCPGGDEIYYGYTGGWSVCPSPGTSGSGKSSITDCYIPRGTSFSDSTGSGIYTDDCQYTMQ